MRRRRASGDRDVSDGVADADADQRRFAAALGRLSSDAFATFVADLWRARGRDVERDGTTLTVRDGNGRTRRLVVTRESPDAIRGAIDADAETWVVTARRIERSDDDSRVIDADELLQTVRYAIDRERASTLLDRHLGEGAAAFRSGADAPARRNRHDVWGVGRSNRAAVTLLLVVCVTAALVVVAVPPLNPFTHPTPTVPSSGSGESGTAQGRTAPTPSAATATPTTPTPTATRTPVDYGALDCPRPPTDVHPARLRPGVVPGASSSGLDGWRILSSRNVTTFEERRALGLPTEPLIRHVARYQSTDGSTYELALDQWESTGVARTVGPALASDSDATIRWGAYTVTVRAFDRDGARASEDTQAGRVNVLVSYVHRPSGIRLGELCVRSLRDENV